MNVRRMTTYFLYSLPLHRHLRSDEIDKLAVGVREQDIDLFRKRFRVDLGPVPAFYTGHYCSTHTPYTVTDVGNPQNSIIPAERLKAHPFFAGLRLHSDLRVGWSMTLALDTVGLLTLCVEADNPGDQRELYRLSGLHLNADYDVIATEPIAHLWRHHEARPEYITLDALARQIHTYLFRRIGKEPLDANPLQHEIQIPLTALEVETNCHSQDEFLKCEAGTLANFVFKPACWEVEQPPQAHIDRILSPDRIWAVSEDALAIVAYEGILYVKICSFDTPNMPRVSGFYLADEGAILHSVSFAVSNYHLLRVVDDLLDGDVTHLRASLPHYQEGLQHLIVQPNDLSLDLLAEINQFIVEVSEFQFLVLDLLEEVDNVDKLIAEEWHIVFLDRLNHVLGLHNWRDSISRRIRNLRELVETLEFTYHGYLSLTSSRSAANSNARLVHIIEHSQRAEERLQWLNYLIGVLGIAELLGLVIGVALDDDHALVQQLQQWLDASALISHLMAVTLILLFFTAAAAVVIWLVNTDPDKLRRKARRQSG